MRSVENQEQLFSYLKHYSESAHLNLVTGGQAVTSIVESVIAADMIEFSDVRQFDKSPEQLITERVRQNIQRMDNTLKIETYGDLGADLGNDLLIDLQDDEATELEVPPSVVLFKT